MSNEIKDWQSDLRAEFEEKVDVLNYLPSVWLETFIPEFKDKLFSMLGSYVSDFIVLQAKEKYGEFRFYYGWEDREYTSEELMDINDISSKIENILLDIARCKQYKID